MQYTPRQKNLKDEDRQLFDSLEPVVMGLKMSLVELSVSRRKGSLNHAGSVQVRAVVLSQGITGVEDCSRVHRALMPRLDLAFPGKDIYLEVSSPGIDRLIKETSEFVHYIGREVRCYLPGISDWSSGVLVAADDKQIILRRDGQDLALPYETIAKARLGASPRGDTGG